MDSVAAADIGVGQLKRGDARLKRLVLKPTVPLLLGKESLAIGNHETEVAGAGLINPREIDFVQNAVTQRKPDLAVLVQCSSCAGFGA